jgi:hypothetical protein
MNGELSDAQKPARRKLCLIPIVAPERTQEWKSIKKPSHNQLYGIKDDGGQGTNDYSRIDELRKLLLARQQGKLNLDDGDLRRTPEQQIFQQPRGQCVLEHRDVGRGPRARDGAAVHNCPSMRALLRNQQRDVRR